MGGGRILEDYWNKKWIYRDGPSVGVCITNRCVNTGKAARSVLPGAASGPAPVSRASDPPRRSIRRPVSRVLSPARSRKMRADGRPFLWDAPCGAPRATNPDGNADAHLPMVSHGRPSLFGLAPGGACHAVPVSRHAVRSYRTLSPLLRPRRGLAERFAFCGAVPRVSRLAAGSPGGRYPPPCIRGARTFLQQV